VSTTFAQGLSHADEVQFNVSSEDSILKDFTCGETKILMCIIKHLKGEINVKSMNCGGKSD